MDECETADFEDCLDVVARLLPEVTDPLLRRGIRGVVANVLYVKTHYHAYGEPAKAEESNHEH